jgi:tetratricopeptide (TPR) repeat protein
LAAYDTALTYFLLGRILNTGDASDAALPQCREAYKRFQGLVDQGSTFAAGMASGSLIEIGDCLLNLGRLQEAASAYEEGIKRSESLKRERDVAVGKLQLGTVRLEQNRYDDALDAYNESRKIFENLGDPSTLAVVWHQIGNVHEKAGQYDASEQAYRKSLAIEVQQNSPAGEAATLLQLGNLYNEMGRLEESVVFLRQTADKYMAIKYPAKEGLARGNLANQLIELNHYAEAREEILRAITCKEPYRHAATPWTSWMILHNLEEAEGNAGAAAQARRKAFELYLAYRNDGGENHEFGGRLCHEFRQAMSDNKTGEMATRLEELANATTTKKLLISKLQAILAGSRDQVLWQDPGLHYMDAVEIKLLLEEIGQ